MNAEMKTWEKRVSQAENHPPTSVGTFIHFDTILAAAAELTALKEENERLVEALNIDIETVGRIMHDSWTRTKRAQGFHHPAEAHVEYRDGVEAGKWQEWQKSNRLPCSKCHYDLLPWEQLHEKQKDINRHAFDDVLVELRRRAVGG